MQRGLLLFANFSFQKAEVYPDQDDVGLRGVAEEGQPTTGNSLQESIIKDMSHLNFLFSDWLTLRAERRRRKARREKCTFENCTLPTIH